jgi:hypothetical protein
MGDKEIHVRQKAFYTWETAFSGRTSNRRHGRIWTRPSPGTLDAAIEHVEERLGIA